MAGNHPIDEKVLRTGIQCLGPYERSVCPVVFNKAATQLVKPTDEENRKLLKIREIKARVAKANGYNCPDGVKKNEWHLNGWLLFRGELVAAGLYNHPEKDPESAKYPVSADAQEEKEPVCREEDQELSAPSLGDDPIGKKLAVFQEKVAAAPSPSPVIEQTTEPAAPPPPPPLPPLPPASDHQQSLRRPLLMDPFAYTANAFLNTRPKDPEMLFDGCPRGSVLALVAPPGAGKSTIVAQMLATFAARQTFFGKWSAHTPVRSLLLSVEDPINVIQQRVHDALHDLPVEMQRGAAEIISVPPVYGHVSLFELHGNSLTAGPNFDDFRAMIVAYKPTLVILDTLSRFGGGVEGDNAAMSEACSYIEEVCCENNANGLVIHHTSKGSGGIVADKEETLFSMLDAYAARGASALTGAVRWQMNLAPLSAELAVKKIGDSARGLPDGVYVACRVSKKNYGKAEGRIFLKHSLSNGLFERVEPLAEEKQAQSLTEDADTLLDALRTREREGLEPVTPSNAGLAVDPPWGKSRTARAVDFCIQAGMLIAEEKSRGKGKILRLPDFANPPSETVDDGGENAF